MVIIITRSVLEKKTVIDTVINFKWREKYTRPFICVYLNKDNSLLALKQPAKTNINEFKYTLPELLNINHTNGNTERSYGLYKEPAMYNPTGQDINECLYLSYNALKPDGSKIALCMNFLSQINIVDLKSGSIKGVRISNTPDFDYLESNSEDLKYFYNFSDADDNYIYGLCSDVKYSELKESVNARTVNVFDWEGNFIRKLYLDQPMDQIRIDKKRRIFYANNFY